MLSKVVWKQITGFSAYEVSNSGEVRRSALPKRVWHGKKPGEHLTPYGKYIRHTLIDDLGKKRYMTAHRMVLFAFVGPPPTPIHEAAHRDDNKKNNNVENLYWATSAQNLADSIRNGRVKRGEAHPKAKISLCDALKIVRLRKTGLSHRVIGERYGVGLTSVYKISRGIQWPEAGVSK